MLLSTHICRNIIGWLWWFDLALAGLHCLMFLVCSLTVLRSAITCRNIFDWLCYILLLVDICTHVADVISHSEAVARAHIRLMAITIILLWLRLMKNARAFALLGKIKDTRAVSFNFALLWYDRLCLTCICDLMILLEYVTLTDKTSVLRNSQSLNYKSTRNH